MFTTPNEKAPLGKVRNHSQLPLQKLTESSRNFLGRRGNSVIGNQNSVGNMLSPSNTNSSHPAHSFMNNPNPGRARLGMKRNSETLPKLNAPTNRFTRNGQSMVSTQMDSEEQQARILGRLDSHKPRIGKRMQSNYPPIKTDILDQHSEFSETDWRSNKPNFVVQPMANRDEVEDHEILITPLSHFDEKTR